MSLVDSSPVDKTRVGNPMMSSVPGDSTGRTLANFHLGEWEVLRLRQDMRGVAVAMILCAAVGVLVRPGLVTALSFGWSCLTLGTMTVLCERATIARLERAVSLGAFCYFASAAGLTLALGPLYVIGPVSLGLGAYNWAQASHSRARRTVLGSALVLQFASCLAGAWLDFQDLGAPWRGVIVGAAFTLATWYGFHAGATLGSRWDKCLGDLAARAADSTRKELLLVEARAELERRALASGRGRYSGQLLGGFELRDLLGRGGMAEVYDARHTASGAPAAVKVILSGLSNEPSIVERFRREANMVAELDSEHVVRVLGVPPRIKFFGQPKIQDLHERLARTRSADEDVLWL